MKRYIRASISDTGIPDTRPTKEQLLVAVRNLRGNSLLDAISRLDSSGDWYREDKRAKRRYLEEVIKNNYIEAPASFWDITDAIDTNDKILYAVYGLSPFSKEFAQRFGHYDLDILYSRRIK